MKHGCIIWGATGQAIVIEDALQGSNHYITAIFDNSPSAKSPFDGVPILHGAEGFSDWLSKNNPSDFGFVVAIGGQKGRERLEIHHFLKTNNLAALSVIHKTSYIASSVQLGEGAQILANATVCARSTLDDCVIVNNAASVDHECRIRRGVHIGPGAILAGCVEVDEYSFIGTNATVLPRVTIGKNVIIGAGAVVTKDVADNSVIVGNPGKSLTKNQQ